MLELVMMVMVSAGVVEIHKSVDWGEVKGLRRDKIRIVPHCRYWRFVVEVVTFVGTLRASQREVKSVFSNPFSPSDLNRQEVEMEDLVGEYSVEEQDLEQMDLVEEYLEGELVIYLPSVPSPYGPISAQLIRTYFRIHTLPLTWISHDSSLSATDSTYFPN